MCRYALGMRSSAASRLHGRAIGWSNGVNSLRFPLRTPLRLLCMFTSARAHTTWRENWSCTWRDKRSPSGCVARRARKKRRVVSPSSQPSITAHHIQPAPHAPPYRPARALAGLVHQRNRTRKRPRPRRARARQLPSRARCCSAPRAAAAMPYCTNCECDVTAECNESDGFTCARLRAQPGCLLAARADDAFARTHASPLRARTDSCCTLCGKVLDDTVFSTDATFSKGPGGASQARSGAAQRAARGGPRTLRAGARATGARASRPHA
jgi:hypothetical protein